MQIPERLANAAFLTSTLPTATPVISPDLDARGDVPFRVFEHRLTEPYPLHWHEFYELAYVVAGTGVHVLNGQALPLSSGTAFLLTPADFHALHPAHGEPLHLINLIFDESVFGSAGESLGLLLLPHVGGLHVGREQETSADEHVRGLFQLIHDESARAEAGYKWVVQAAICQLIILLSRYMLERQVSLTDAGNAVQTMSHLPVHPCIHRALFYLHQHFREPLRLREVARQVGLAPTYFSELFQRDTGEAFSTFLLGLRLRFAASLLAVSSLPITEVAYGSGFANLSHFTRAFKAHYGCAPRMYRRLNAT